MNQNDINKVELRGRVGTVKLTSFGERSFLQFTVATDYIYEDYDINQVIETTWHKCSAWSGQSICPLSSINKGDIVHLTGRLKSTRLIGQDGGEMTIVEIVPETLKKEEDK